MRISRIAEELFPIPHYLVRSRRKKRLCDSRDILCEPEFANYETLFTWQLQHRLKDEHQRASAMDEKTFKLTLSLSIGLTVLGSIAAFLTKAVSSATIQTISTILICFGVLYVLLAGFVALGALRTLPSFGYGTQFLLRQKKDEQKVLADALARQETMNIIRHLRNETAYQTLRNGLWLLFVGIVIFATALVLTCPPFFTTNLNPFRG